MNALSDGEKYVGVFDVIRNGSISLMLNHHSVIANEFFLSIAQPVTKPLNRQRLQLQLRRYALLRPLPDPQDLARERIDLLRADDEAA